MTREWNGRVAQAYQVFFEAMKRDSIHELVKAAGDFWHYGILLTDENYYLISQYPRKKIGEEVWDTLYEHRVLSYELIRSYQEMYLQNKHQTYEPFYADWGLIGAFPRIFAEIYAGERILGHVGIFLMGHVFQEEDLEVAQIFVDALRMKMAFGYRPSLSTYLADLLHDNTSSYLKEWAAETLGKAVEKSYVMMVTPVGESASQKAFAEYSVNQAPKTFRNTVATVYDNAIVTLLGEMNRAGQEVEVSFLRRAAAFYAKGHAVSGVSDSFDELLQVPYQYQQAALTASLSREPLAFYRDCAPAPLFLYVSRNTNPQAFIHPVLFDISRYDKENNTNYFSSLRQYCFTMHNMEAAAKSLFIHRNTLAYRLNRISELFGISFEDERTARYLLSSFELWEVE